MFFTRVFVAIAFSAMSFGPTRADAAAGDPDPSFGGPVSSRTRRRRTPSGRATTTP